MTNRLLPLLCSVAKLSACRFTEPKYLTVRGGNSVRECGLQSEGGDSRVRTRGLASGHKDWHFSVNERPVWPQRRGGRALQRTDAAAEQHDTGCG